MPTIHKTISIKSSAAHAWEAIDDFYHVHTRCCPGFVTNTEATEGGRIVTFGNGMIATEIFLGRNENLMRTAYSVQSEKFTHHNASFQVINTGKNTCDIHWVADILPETLEPMVSGMMQQGIDILKTTLESSFKL